MIIFIRETIKQLNIQQKKNVFFVWLKKMQQIQTVGDGYRAKLEIEESIARAFYFTFKTFNDPFAMINDMMNPKCI